MFANARCASTAQGAWIATLTDLAALSEEVGADPSRELLGYDITVENARARVINHPARPLPIVSAVARFVWMMAGNQRLADIEFYEPQVKRYSDDGLVVPGSDYGARLRHSTPGQD